MDTTDTFTAPVQTAPDDLHEALKLPFKGIDRNLGLLLYSFLRQGFLDAAHTDFNRNPLKGEISITPFMTEGWHQLSWSSPSVSLCCRAWTLKVDIRLEDGGISLRQARFTVGCIEHNQATTWTGGGLDLLVLCRLRDVIAVIGARLSDPSGELTDEELLELNGTLDERKAFIKGEARVVLYDDQEGHGGLHATGSEVEIHSIYRELVEKGFAFLMS
jgi:hypothetical protein